MSDILSGRNRFNLLYFMALENNGISAALGDMPMLQRYVKETQRCHRHATEGDGTRKRIGVPESPFRFAEILQENEELKKASLATRQSLPKLVVIIKKKSVGEFPLLQELQCAPLRCRRESKS
ncbi:hypothetical protein J6590_076670 [Homalodisca vitripennis]|nr:hypothetical protein J6590_076670 [Homalodisca vitripennis]